MKCKRCGNVILENAHAECGACSGQLQTKVNELEAIVDRLPKTADGVPITQGMTVFCTHRGREGNIDILKKSVSTILEGFAGNAEIHLSGYGYKLPAHVWSTLEAAEAALAARTILG